MEDEKRQSTVKDAHGQKNNQSQLNNNHKIALYGADCTSHDLIVSGKPGANPYGGTGGEAWSCQSCYDHRVAETGSEVDGCNLGRTYHPVECPVRKYGGVTIQSGRCGMQHPDHDTA